MSKNRYICSKIFSMIYNTILELVGKTPLLRLQKIAPTGVDVLLKQGQNPAGSIKDRVALQLLADAENRGLLDKDTVIIECTSGNTGIGLAMCAAVKGYPLVIIMPDNVSSERPKILRAYGAEVLFTPASEGMKGCLDFAETLRTKYKKVFFPYQFVNPSNPLAHELSTGLEIWQDTAGKVDIVVVGMGTGGSISGIAKALKNKNPNIQIIGVEPEESPLLTKGYIGPHKLQGIGMSAGFIPPILAQDLIDEVVVANHSEAIAMLRLLAQKEGVFVGVSSGAILHAALQVAQRAENQGKTIVVPMMDGAYRYLSEDIFA
jgi:cysteine synthase A